MKGIFRIDEYLIRINRLRRPRPSAILCAALLSPMGIAVTVPIDSTTSSIVTGADETAVEKMVRFKFGAGAGTYGRTIHEETTRTYFYGYDGCTGEPISNTVTFDGDFNFKDEFEDYGGELDVQVSDRTHIGIRGGRVNERLTYWSSSLDEAAIDTLFQYVEPRDTSFSYNYFNPYFAHEKDRFGFGVGFVYSDSRLWTDEKRELKDHNDATFYPTGHLRFGDLDKFYLMASLWESVPIYSGGGMWVIGLGARPVAPLELFGGFATGGPYTEDNILLRANLDLGRHFTLGGNMRLKEDVSESILPSFDEYGNSVSLTYNLYYH